jgi:hypothetical protein
VVPIATSTVATPHLQLEGGLLLDTGRPLRRRRLAPGWWRRLGHRLQLQQAEFDAVYGLLDGFELLADLFDRLVLVSDSKPKKWPELG